MSTASSVRNGSLLNLGVEFTESDVRLYLNVGYGLVEALVGVPEKMISLKKLAEETDARLKALGEKTIREAAEETFSWWKKSDKDATES